jgi:DNA-binding transcriptional LysR family regulator
MELKDIDLNLLVVFHELLRERRVSAVADKLDISQPAISNALNRLRKVLGDELFLRTSKGMVPTPYAETLAEPISMALEAIHGSLNVSARFDPSTSTRTFTLATTDLGEIYFLPTIMKQLARLAPGVVVNSVHNQSPSLLDELERGQVDLAIGYFPELKTGLYQRRLFRQRYVCLFRKGHPLERTGVTMKSFVNAEHVSILAEGSGHDMVDTAIQRAGVKRKVHLRIPQFVSVGHILQSTDLVAVVPEAYVARALIPFGLQSAPCPVKIPEITINVLWHARNHRDTGNQWLRQLVFDEFVL